MSPIHISSGLKTGIPIQVCSHDVTVFRDSAKRPQEYHRTKADSGIFNFLQRRLPYSLPLYRRLEHGRIPAETLLLSTLTFDDATNDNLHDDSTKGNSSSSVLSAGNPDHRTQSSNGDTGESERADQSQEQASNNEYQEPFAILLLDPMAINRPMPDGVAGMAFSSLELPFPNCRETRKLFLNLEGSENITTPIQVPEPTKPEQEEVARHFAALLKYARAELDPLTSVQGGVLNGVVAPPNDRNSSTTKESDQQTPRILKLSATHTHTAACLRTLITKETNQPLIRDDVYGKGGPYSKYTFRTSSIISSLSPHLSSPSAYTSAPPSLPTGVKYDSIKPQDYDAIIASNPFVGSGAFLETMVSAGVREVSSGRLVAWAFIGSDGSIRTVHCEPDWRRNGLARAVVWHLIVLDRDERGLGVGGSSESQIANGHVSHDGLKDESRNEDVSMEKVEDCMQIVDISPSNEASIRLFEGTFGARFAWDNFWIFLDMDRISGLQTWKRFM